MASEKKPIAAEDVKLFVTEIKTGSIETVLAGASEFMGIVSPVIQYATWFSEFTFYIERTIDYFLGKGDKQKDYDKQDCEDFADFLAVVSDNKDNHLKMTVAEFAKDGPDGAVLARFEFSGEQALTAQKGAINAKEELERRGAADYEAVIMRLYQTNTGEAKERGRTGDRAIVDEILPGKDLPVFFVGTTGNDKRQMLHDPFKRLYVVDINVGTVNGEPRLYRVVALRDTLPIDESDDAA